MYKGIISIVLIPQNNVAAAAAKSLQLCPTLCDPLDSSPQGSPIPGILQARTLEWVATSFSNAWRWKVKAKSLSCVRPSATHRLQPTRLPRPWDFPGKSTGVGFHCLLHKIMLLHSIFYSSCTSLHSHDQCPRVLISQHSHQCLFFYIFVLLQKASSKPKFRCSLLERQILVEKGKFLYSGGQQSGKMAD